MLDTMNLAVTVVTVRAIQLLAFVTFSAMTEEIAAMILAPYASEVSEHLNEIPSLIYTFSFSEAYCSNWCNGGQCDREYSYHHLDHSIH